MDRPPSAAQLPCARLSSIADRLVQMLPERGAQRFAVRHAYLTFDPPDAQGKDRLTWVDNRKEPRIRRSYFGMRLAHEVKHPHWKPRLSARPIQKPVDWPRVRHTPSRQALDPSAPYPRNKGSFRLRSVQEISRER